MGIKSLGKYLKTNQLLVVFNSLMFVVFLVFFLANGFAERETPTNTANPEPQTIVFEERLLPDQNDPLYLKPIFHADRHPAKKPLAPVQAVVETPFRLELTGVLSVSDEMGWAFFRQTNGQEAHQISLGETIDGWTLESLGENQAVLAKGEVRKTLLLKNPLAIGPGTNAPETLEQSQKPRTRKRK